jgi:conjugal transfer pilus assembly protein TraD
MSLGEENRKEQNIVLAVFFVLAALWIAFSIGVLCVAVAILTVLALRLFRAPLVPTGVVVLAAIAAGIAVYQDAAAWMFSPVLLNRAFLTTSLPEGLLPLLLERGAFSGFWTAYQTQIGIWMGLPELWLHHAPLGVFTGAAAYGLYSLKTKNPLGTLKRQKQMERSHPKVSDLSAAVGNVHTAHTANGSVIGTDRFARVVELMDKVANQHTLVLGTTGSGKTVTVCNIVESAINRGLPLIYIDGKGDYDLAQRVAAYAKEQRKPVFVFSMKGESVSYNPLAAGGFTSKKDRIIELREWSEEHYKKLAEGYLQTVFKVLEKCHLPSDLYTLSKNLDLKRLKALVRENESLIPEAQDLMDELNSQDQAAKSIESLIAEIRNFTSSEIGHLFKIEEGKPALTLQGAIEQGGIVYFCLPALEFPSMAQTIGRLIVNDLKATMAQQLGNREKPKLYVVLDEFSVFAGEQILNVINMGRSAGIHAVLSTQSLSDIAAGRKENGDHFINQVVSNCNNFILHRQNSPEDAEKLAAMIGTTSTLEYTAQVSQTGPTHMGTVRRTRGFIAHPDEIKSLQTGEAFFFSKENNKVSRIKARRSRI